MGPKSGVYKISKVCEIILLYPYFPNFWQVAHIFNFTISHRMLFPLTFAHPHFHLYSVYLLFFLVNALQRGGAFGV